jgi:alkanesulfonate monooxygenase SsuD/methylene tetrahydromethanopterin reductase-like flavin-dependent oxidoreductase (luciferase family)
VRLTAGTAVTCPTIRIHPAIIGQAAATVGALTPSRFFLGVGTGELLNEAELRWLLATLDRKARDALRRALIRDQADRDAIASRLM